MLSNEKKYINDRRRILFISNYFAPDATIGAVRTSKFVKYLRKFGYEVVVISEKKKQIYKDKIIENDVKDIKIYYAENSKIYKKIFALYQKITANYRCERFKDMSNRKRINIKTGKEEFYTFETAYPFVGSLDYIFREIKQIDLCINIKEMLKKENNYDYIITSYGDSFSYYAGKYFHRINPKIPWIFDIRDAIFRYKFVPSYVSWIPYMYEKSVWKEANHIIGVSQGICKRVPAEYKKKVTCITNGFDLHDRKGLNSERFDTENIIFSYTGSMYGGLMDLTVFFDCIRVLIDRKEINKNSVEFHFAGNDSAFDIFREQANKAGLRDRCYSHGRISREKSMELQQRSDILLMASYDYKNNEGGIITGKVLEYMGANRPIICIINGDIEKSELAEIISKTNVGFVYEESNHAVDFAKLCSYMRFQYQFFKKNHISKHNPNKKEIEKYNYDNLSRKLLQILNRL